MGKKKEASSRADGATTYVRVSVAAELLSVSDETVYRMAQRGQLAYLRDPITGRWRFVRSLFDAYIAANTVEALLPRVDPTPLPRTPRRRRSTAGMTPVPDANDPPWKGFVFGDRTTRKGGAR